MPTRLTQKTLVELLSATWQDVLGRPIGPEEDFFGLGGSSIQAAMITNRVQEYVGILLHPAALFDAPTITALADWYCMHHPEVFSVGGSSTPGPLPTHPLTTAKIALARNHFLTRNTSPDLAIDHSGGRNRPAIFILCPPRSGSTLLRVMLGGHPGLFCPPELYLLSFATLDDRRSRFSGRYRYLGDGLVRAVMALKKIDRAGAESLIDDLADEGTSTHDLYDLIQAWAEDRRLVDKTPTYALNPMTLRRAEAEFDNASFIHLVRHPMACVASFAELRADLATGDETGALPTSARQRGELWWLISQANIIDFLREIPEQRKHQIHFEDLVRDPKDVMRGLCDRLGLDFVDDMLSPHADRASRMTDGVTEHSRMLGDQKFHRHREIDPAVADRWRATPTEDSLCEQTWTLARSLGYAREIVADDKREEWEF